MYAFGKSSLKKLSLAHNDWQLILNIAIAITPIDFGIAETYRSIHKQKQYFDQGLSKIDGISRTGKHNYNPSLAVDIYAFVNNKASWEPEHITYISGLIHGVTEMLLVRGEISHRVRWGGNWDMDGEILLDQSFDDRPHFELIKA